MKKSLKPGATVVIVDPHDDEIVEELKSMGKKIEPDRLTIGERIKKECEEAGYELTNVLTFLPGDDIYILKVK